MSHLLIFHENAYSLSAAFSLEFNILAAQSARAQLLKNPLTTLDGIANNKSHRVHTLVINNLPVAYLKVGEKNLLVQDEFARHVQIYPPCVLDFYVRTDVQRKGYGKTLFQHMLMLENLNPGCIAYDRPSIKLSAFLEKHYNLNKNIPQSNRFLIFKEMGLNSIATKPKSRFDRFTDNFSTRTHYVPPLNAKTSLDIELENDTLSADQNVSLPDNCTLINNTANNKLDEMEFTQTIPESCARAEPGFDIQKGYQITTQIQIPPPIHTSNRFYSLPALPTINKFNHVEQLGIMKGNGCWDSAPGRRRMYHSGDYNSSFGNLPKFNRRPVLPAIHNV